MISSLHQKFVIHQSFFLLRPRPPSSTLFPYTTLFRSIGGTAADIAIQADLYAKNKEEMNHLQAEHTGKTVEQIGLRSEEHTSELQSPDHLVCRLLLEKKKKEEFRNQDRGSQHIKKRLV